MARAFNLELNMNQKFIKWAGLIGSVLLGTIAIMKGDVVSGVDVITSALSSASVFGPGQ